MTADERLDYLKSARVIDRSQLSERAQLRSKAMLEEARENLKSLKQSAEG